MEASGEVGKDLTAFASKADLERCVIANAFVMFFAGFDTTSTNSSLCAFFLAKVGYVAFTWVAHISIC